LKRINIMVLTVIVILVFCLFAGGCGKESSEEPEVVVYTSVDQIYAEPIFKKFEKLTGIKVLTVYDVEAAKTTGLVNRLIAEQDNPQADVFWNGEFVQTLLLKEKGVLARYNSPSAEDIPDNIKDSEGYWAGAGGRCRIIMVNMELLSPEDYPYSIFDLLDEKYPADKVGIAYPMFGTTAAHAAALYASLGNEKGKDYFLQLQERGVQVLDGNSVVRDMVADGRLMMGLTDTDDAAGAVQDGKPVQIIFPDQDDMGTLIIPYTVGLIASGPNPDEGKQLMDFLLGEKVEKMMIEIGFSQVSVRPLDIEPEYVPADGVKTMDVTFSEVYDQLECVKNEMRQIFVR